MHKFLTLDNLDTWRPGAAIALALIAAIAFASWFLAIWPTEYMYDDGGIVLRYMDNFANGHPYRYNAADPPVFGVSGFIHATVAGALSASRLVSPEDSLIVSGYVGMVLVAFMVFLILRLFTSSFVSVVFGWAFTISACFFLLINTFQGLEASLHLGIVLLCCWAFLSQRWRAMWALMALTIVSKLDATPVVLVLVLLRSLSLRSRSEWASEVRRATIWGGLPLLGWVVFSSAYFGSPLPQSAATKMEFHYHPPSRIEFVTQWWKRDESRIITYWVFIAIGIVMGAVRGRRDLLRSMTWPGALIGVLALYLIFNPGERMPWYYVMPQALLVLGAVTGLLSALKTSPRLVALIVPLLIFGAALPTNIDTAKGRARGDLAYIRTVEPERIAIGQYIHAHADDDDRLLTGHGYVARYARIHTHDLSGLNSPEVTRLRAERRPTVEALEPDWVAFPAMVGTNTQQELGYRLDKVFYDRSSRGHPAWRVWHRAPGRVAVAVRAADFRVGKAAKATESRSFVIHEAGAGETTGPGLVRVDASHEVTLRTTRVQRIVGIDFGITRQDQELDLRVFAAGELVAELDVPPRDRDDLVAGRSSGFRVDLPLDAAPVRIEVVADDGVEPLEGFQLLEPVWLLERKSGSGEE